MNEWKTVSYGKNKYRKRKTREVVSLCYAKEAESEHPLRFHVERVATNVHELLNTAFCDKFLSQLRNVLQQRKASEAANIKEIVCYGLGSPSDNISAVYQLSLLVIIHRFSNYFYSSSSFVDISLFKRTMLEAFKRGDGKVEDCFLISSFLYDPVFTEGDNQLLRALGFGLIQENEFGRRCSNNTIFYMIHCDKWLYNNLLWKNWSLSKLTNMILIGNSFSLMLERHPRRILKDQYEYIYLSLDLTLFEEFSVDNWKDHDSIFHDTAVLVFSHEKCNQVDYASTRHSECPIYDNSGYC